MPAIEIPRFLLRGCTARDILSFGDSNSPGEVMSYLTDGGLLECYAGIRDTFSPCRYAPYATEQKEDGACTDYKGFHTIRLDVEAAPRGCAGQLPSKRTCFL